MKKLLAMILVVSAGMGACVANAEAHGYYYRGGGYYRANNSWVAPALIGGVVGYGLARSYQPYYAPPPVYYTPPPVVYTPPPVYVQQPAPYVEPGCTTTIYKDRYGNYLREETRCN